MIPPSPSSGQDRRLIEMIALCAEETLAHSVDAIFRVLVLGKAPHSLELSLKQKLPLRTDRMALVEDSAAATGSFDIAIVAAANGDSAEPLLSNIKPRLKNSGYLIVEAEFPGAADALYHQKWRAALSKAGFVNIVARSERNHSQFTDTHDLWLGRSEGLLEAPSLPPSNLDRTGVREKVIQTLVRLLHVPVEAVDTSAAFTDFGMDSISGIAFINELKKVLGADLNPTALFDYSSIDKLTGFIVGNGVSSIEPKTFSAPEEPSRKAALAAATDIAVIGMSGRFPGADNVRELWTNLAGGKNSISEIPSDRWDHGRFFDPSGKRLDKTASKWGGFLRDADKFDPLFFNISGREAEAADPQHRLFLQEAYHALEDAGYLGAAGQRAKKCGVFAGVEPGDYMHLLLDLAPTEKAPVFQGNAESILAARISYFLDLKGPSIAINTACSSSLVAIHLACRSLLDGDCDLALAGGVRVFSSEKAYLALGNMGMLSPEGQCKTFDESADGFVPGEAVGVLVLKPLAQALADRDHIYGIIKGSATNQDGKTNGITAPSSLSQTSVELDAYRKSHVDPSTVQYVEAHGTGTKLGDPIEVWALTEAFRKFTPEKNFCALASVKTNIGHTMAAAGVCGVIKVLLSLQHKQIPPSLNLRQKNSYIDFENSPFFVNTELRPWAAPAGQPRRACVSSFGFSGTNAHLVLEEAAPSPRAKTISSPAYLITLSARGQPALINRARELKSWLSENIATANLADLSFTLNTGRDHFETRCALLATSLPRLLELLGQVETGASTRQAWFSEPSAAADKKDAALFYELGSSLLAALANLRADAAQYTEKLSALASLYARGVPLAFEKLYTDEACHRISLPGYPFARDRYWVDISPRKKAGLHPLVHQNVSTLDQTEFESSFTGEEFFLRDHRIDSEALLPGVTYLEMVSAAIEAATGTRAYDLENIGWMQPYLAAKNSALRIRLERRGNEIHFTVVSQPNNTVHMQGKAVPSDGTPSEVIDLNAVRARCGETENPIEIYNRCQEAGLNLGPSFQTIRENWFNTDEALARLELNETSDSSAFLLHPGILDGMFQTSAVLGRGKANGLPVPFSLQKLRFQSTTSHCFAHVRCRGQTEGMLRYDASILDADGKIIVALTGLFMRLWVREAEHQLLYAKPIWRVEPLPQNVRPAFRGPLLVFDETGTVTELLRAAAPDLKFVRVAPTADWRAGEEVIYLDPKNPSHYERLVDRISPSCILHAAGLAWSHRSLFLLSRALMKMKVQAELPILVLYPSDSDPLFASARGFAKTLRLERPNLKIKTVEISDLNAPAILAEIFAGESEVRLGPNQRAVKSLVSYVPQPSQPLPLSKGKTYLITGGLGALGTIFARYLASEWNSHLVILGRSPSESAREKIEELERLGAKALYLRCDVADAQAVTAAVRATTAHFGAIHGVIHAAGTFDDSFIFKKEWQAFAEVLAPKIDGAANFDAALADQPLDFFVLFSSIAGIFGNVGQADYACANAYLDAFALQREALRQTGARRGRTLSIAWPLWNSNGMKSAAGADEAHLRRFGLTQLPPEKGLEIFLTLLQSPEAQSIPLFGNTEKIRTMLLDSPPPKQNLPAAAKAKISFPIAPVLEYLVQRFSALVKIPADRIKPEEPMERYGIDSMMVLDFTQLLEKDFGELSKTLLFEHQTLRELAEYFIATHPQTLERLFDQTTTVAPPAESIPIRASMEAAQNPKALDDIAIVGLFGRFPQADDLDEFWQNLSQGKDCITEIPPERWDYKLFYDSERGQPGKTWNKWGGFLRNVENFDAHFFNIMPREAMALDPQERLFLETVWRAVEDAGYSKTALSNKSIGVYVGVMYGEYQLYSAGNLAEGKVYPLSSSYASIANRVSWFFNWHGPSMAIDTMCSSSLTAIHLACESIQRGEIEAAIAGGVNCTLHPHKDMLLAPGGFPATDGRCRSFGEGGDGYVPGEGVGAVLLKPLARALADGDHIHGVIKASVLNHGGKTNGYTVPNPKAQGALIRSALEKAKIDPSAINVIEAHGTGTSLGDPIEISALVKSFRDAAGPSPLVPQACAVGSVKSNIGHLEAAAGIAGLAKVLLQMRHQQIAPSLHSTKLNPNIDFRNSPFHVPQTTQPWAQVNDPSTGALLPRRAGISSFGAGGSNAHLIVQEFAGHSSRTSAAVPWPLLFVFSAKNEDRLRSRLQQFLGWLQQAPRTVLDLADAAFTLQVGREHLPERIALLSNSSDELAARLEAALNGKPIPMDDAFDLAQSWLAGEAVDFHPLWKNWTPRRLPLPTYPFAGERYWAPDHLPKPIPIPDAEPSDLLFLRPAWREQSALPVDLGQINGELLLFDSDETLAHAIRQTCPRLKLTMVRPDDSFESRPGTISINPSDESHYAKLLEIMTPDFVIHAWNETPYSTGFLSLFNLARAFIKRSVSRPIQILCLASPAENLFSSLGGFARTLAQEQPFLQLKAFQAEADAPAILLELFTRAPDREIRVRDGRREIRILKEDSFLPSIPSPLRRKGVYLITGGLGGLGFIFAEYLARTLNARLILTGRSAAGDDARKKIATLEALGSEVLYIPGDIASPSHAQHLVSEARARFGALHGVLHTAGVLRDGFILRKEISSVREVLHPKIAGALSLDAALAAEPLDFFVLFSSTAGTFGNVGQSDYAFANAFLDRFAEAREERRAAGQVFGKTISIAWPLWMDGGMQIPGAVQRLKEIGLRPLTREIGFQIFEKALAGPGGHLIPLWGAKEKIRRLLEAAPPSRPETSANTAPQNLEQIHERLEAHLKETLAAVTHLPLEQIDPHLRFEEFGVDSIVISDFNLKLEKNFGALPKTLLFEHPNLHAVAKHLLSAHRSQVISYFPTANPPASQTSPIDLPTTIQPPTPAARERHDIAIIGLAGKYPNADNLDSFWKNLRAGANSITEVPRERWNSDELFDPDPAKASEGKIYCRWGGFISDVDKFDALFFNISPLEAELMDPQERLFLETAWATLEDAGYPRQSHGSPANVGVFVGVTANTYSYVAQENGGRRWPPTSLPWSLANRVSYLFNFSGPSMPVDTACSSSLTAIHLACQALRRGECDAAIAGGVNLYLHPSKYANLCLMRMLSKEGQCRAFGAGGDGFVPGEGVGAVLLKPLQNALADGDHIYGVIKGTAVNHGGHTTGYTVPSPVAHADLITQAARDARLDLRALSYIEAHGTGTALGDPIEIAGLARAFGNSTADEPRCAIGSVKSNIGHLEAAAGIAALTKVLLQMKFGELVPSLHGSPPNPNITFTGAPFVVQHELQPWLPDSTLPRRAGISSFGAGGANAHIIVEEFPPQAETPSDGPALIVLSARTSESLRALSANLRNFILSQPAPNLQSIAFTLQTGREAFEERAAFVAASIPDLISHLAALENNTGAVPHRGRIRRQRGQSLAPDRDLHQLAALWVSGAEVDWHALYENPKPRRISLPTYPFARQRHWIPLAPDLQETKRLHPLVHENISTFSDYSFRSRFDARDPVLAHHRVNGKTVLPGAATLEMALAAASILNPATTFALKNVVWSQPLAPGNGPLEIRIALKQTSPSEASVEFSTAPAGVHFTAKALPAPLLQTETLDLAAIRTRSAQTCDIKSLYLGFKDKGLDYGETFQVIQQIAFGAGEVLGRLCLPASAGNDGFRLNPWLVDGALQSLALLGAGAGGLELPFAVDSVHSTAPLPRTCLAYAKIISDETASRRYDIKIADGEGLVLATLKGLTVRKIISLQQAAPPAPPTTKVHSVFAAAARQPRQKLIQDLKSLIAKVLKLDLAVIEENADLTEYGFDSITFTTLSNEVNAAFATEITPATLFEHTTIETVADFLLQNFPAQIAAQFPSLVENPPAASSVVPTAPSPQPTRSFTQEPIAIIGMHGVFPGSPDLEAFWKNLEEGRDLISRAPAERWNFPGLTLSAPEHQPPWGGFLDQVDQFDSLFFDISPREAQLMDPQQRLFLQTTWNALEDAGYSKTALAGTRTGVFVGVAANDYANLLAIHGVPIEGYSSTGNAHSVLVNRISFFLDLHGPSEAIDTACSSSLVAIHRAIESMQCGSCEMAIVGGVNVLLSPGAFTAFGKAGMLSPDGRCKTFDEKANGYARGEGVGAVILKPLSRAQADGDPIYAVIIGSAENHGGHVQSLTVPNPNAQAQLLQDAFHRAGIDPATIGFIEAHGTGTALGDPIEINGLKKAFGAPSKNVPAPRCAIGSLKANIGHLETAAGIAGLIKVLLALRAKRIPANAHLHQLNPYIQIEDTPFHFPQVTEVWEALRDEQGRPLPRRAGVSSFGFGGSNAHILLEEFSEPQPETNPPSQLPALVIISARTRNELAQRARQLLDSVDQLASPAPLLDLAYTLQIGREPMAQRAAFLVASESELKQKLRGFIAGETTSDIFSGHISESKAAIQLLRQIQDDAALTQPLLDAGDLRRLALSWIAGIAVKWEGLYRGLKPRRLRLPGYPFAQERHWLPTTKHASVLSPSNILHPLIHQNESTLKEQSFVSHFSGHEEIFASHQILGQKMLPGAASLEMALQAVVLSTGSAHVRLAEVFWLKPISGAGAIYVHTRIRPITPTLVEFEIHTAAGLHIRGKADLNERPPAPPADLIAIKARCTEAFDPAILYQTFAAKGFAYGPAFQTITAIAKGADEVWARLIVPKAARDPRYRAHPCLLDGAFQALAILKPESDSPQLPFSIDSMECAAAIPDECFLHGKITAKTSNTTGYALQLLDDAGQVLLSIQGFTLRGHDTPGPKSEMLLYRPVWTAAPLTPPPKPLAGTLLLFSESLDSAMAITHPALRIIRVIPGIEYSNLQNQISLRRHSFEDYERLLSETSPAFIIHAWAKKEISTQEALDSGIHTIHPLVRAAAKLKRALRIAVVYPAEDQPAWEAIAGYAKTLVQERPNIRLKTVAASPSLDLIAELTDENFEVRVSDQARQIKTLQEIPIPSDQPAIAAGSVILISGGAGALGILFSQQLIKNYQAQLVLVGRSPLEGARKDAIRKLGASAIYVQGDISNPADAEKAVRAAHENFGRLDGVIHAAGEIRDSLIQNKDQSSFDQVLQPKLWGLQHLDHATQNENLQFFILFSSTAALFGNVGQCDYAFANACLDAFAWHRERLRASGVRQGRTLSINWPFWAAGGMGQTNPRQPANKLGLTPLDAQAGWNIFLAALATAETQIWGCLGQREKIHAALFPSHRDTISPPAEPPVWSPGFSRSPARAESLSPANAASSASLRDFLIVNLVKKFAEVSRIPAAALTPSDPLENQGLDSILAVEFSQLLQKDFSEISSAILFEQSNLESLADFLLRERPDDCARLLQKNPVSPDPLPIALPRNGNGHAEPSLILQEISGNGNARPFRGGLARSIPMRTIPLAPMDYLFLGPERLSIQIFYWFEKKLDFNSLRTGLEKVCREFFPANGELLRIDPRNFAIRECADAPDFQEVICPPDASPPRQDSPATFAPYRLDLDPEKPSQKFARFRLFQFAGGSLLGVNMSHAIADGYSFYYFMGAWASASQGLEFPRPDHSRAKLNQIARSRLARKNPALRELEFSIPKIDPSFSITNVTTETFALDPAVLCAEAMRNLDSSTKASLSENGILSAWAWKKYAQTLPTNIGQVTLACPIDCRRLCSQLTPSFFGNAVVPAILQLPRRRILAEPLSTLALAINAAVRSTDENHFRSLQAALESMRRKGGMSALRKAALVNPQNGLLVTNVARFPHPPIDFGSGPCQAELTPVNYAGAAIIFPGADSQIQIRISFAKTRRPQKSSPKTLLPSK